MREAVWSITILVGALLGMKAGHTAELYVSVDSRTQSFTTDQLMQRTDAVDIRLTQDPFYGNAGRTYRAVPASSLLEPLGFATDSELQIKANDGFVTELPGELVLNRDPDEAIALVAIDPSDQPWPPLQPSDKEVTPGPFALIWTGKRAAAIYREQWPYQMAALTEVEEPTRRWPQLAVEPSLPTDSPIRRGLSLFLTQCFVCHQLDGAGPANLGPDLNRPMSPTSYFQPAALSRYIRDPASVQDWADRRMPAFPIDTLSDRDINDVIAYLAYKDQALPQ